jgi:hypothetical protein
MREANFASSNCEHHFELRFLYLSRMVGWESKQVAASNRWILLDAVGFCLSSFYFGADGLRGTICTSATIAETLMPFPYSRIEVKTDDKGLNSCGFCRPMRWICRNFVGIITC